MALEDEGFPTDFPWRERLRDGRSEDSPMPTRGGELGGELPLGPAVAGAWSFESNTLTLKPGATHLLVQPLRTMVVRASCVS